MLSLGKNRGFFSQVMKLFMELLNVSGCQRMKSECTMVFNSRRRNGRNCKSKGDRMVVSCFIIGKNVRGCVLELVEKRWSNQDVVDSGAVRMMVRGVARVGLFGWMVMPEGVNQIMIVDKIVHEGPRRG